jgi:hypothetical protein
MFSLLCISHKVLETKRSFTVKTDSEVRDHSVGPS